MLLAREHQGQLEILDRLRETVRLAEGLDANNILSDASCARALHCLTRFGQRIKNIPNRYVRVVGTNTLRRADNTAQFLRQARQALGHPIDIIAGREEARLIYLGVANTDADFAGHRLVIDIGGGSTELIVGQGFQALERESLYMGCVSMSLDFFADGKISKKALRKAELAARLELMPVLTKFKKIGWQTALGASGTIKAAAAIMQAMGWSKGHITRDGMLALRSELLAAKHVSRLQLNGLVEDRRVVLPGGYAILQAIFDCLDLQQLDVAKGALREGVLNDLVGRTHADDIRGRTINILEERYGIDKNHAERVAKTAQVFFEQVSSVWDLDAGVHGELLQWAAQVHEVGLVIAHAQYHRHAEYLLTHSDLPGFSRQEQRLLALLVRAHRRKLPSDLVVDITDELQVKLLRLVVLLRLAVLLHRSRGQMDVPNVAIKVSESEVYFGFPGGWLKAHSLAEALLNKEKDYLRAVGFNLSFG